MSEKVYILKVFGRFEITGRGTVFAVHRDENEVEGIDIGSHLVTEKDGKKYEVRGIEYFKNNFGAVGKNIGLLVKEL